MAKFVLTIQILKVSSYQTKDEKQSLISLKMWRSEAL